MFISTYRIASGGHVGKTALVINASNLLTMKSKVVLPPPGCFSSADIYCQKHWRTVQHIAKEFW